MGKLKLNKREIKAVKDTIAHWKKDVRAKLKKGIAIKEAIFGLIWADNAMAVNCYSGSCPLCKIYYGDSKDDHCVACPYYKKYGIDCTASGHRFPYKSPIGHWRKFRQNPCLKTCNGMIKALENILK